MALGAPITGRAAESVVDPEALLLLSCGLRGHERRLDDVLAWWAGAGAELLSLQRVRTLARHFLPAVQRDLAAFAHTAVDQGHSRWAPLAAESADDGLAARGKRGGEPRLLGRPSLVLRLRAAFSVGVKADVLAVLLAVRGDDETVRGLVRATGYTAAAVRRSLQEMQAARIVWGTSNRPASYYVDASAWSVFLDLDTTRDGEWKYFGDVFAFLLATIAWGEAGDDDGYVAATAAREIVETHRSAFELNRMIVPGPEGAAGTRYLDVFRDVVSAVKDWLTTAL